MSVTQNDIKIYNDFVNLTAEYFGINPETIKMRNNKQKPSHARHIVTYVLSKLYGFNSYKVGLLINRNRIVVKKKVAIIEEDLYGKSKNQTTIDCYEYLIKNYKV